MGQINGQREGDFIFTHYDGKDVIINVEAAPVPGLTPHTMKSGVRLDIEMALKLIDDLKTNINHAMKHR